MKVRAYLLENDTVVVRPIPDTEPQPPKALTWIENDSGIITDWPTATRLATMDIRQQYVIDRGLLLRIEQHRPCKVAIYKMREDLYDASTKQPHICAGPKPKGYGGRKRRK